MTAKDFATANLYLSQALNVDFDTLIRVVQAQAGLQNTSYESFQRRDGEFLWLAFGKQFHLKVEVVRSPLGTSGFANALETPIAKLVNKDFAKIMSQNKEYILITVGVGDGVIPGGVMADPKIAGMMADIGLAPNETPAERRFRLKILNILTRHIFSVGEPDLIHVTNSEMLFTPDMFRPYLTDDFPLAVFTQAYLQSTIDPKTGGQLFGAYLVGGDDILGPRLSMKPSPLKPATVVDQLLAFVGYCLMIDKVLDNGETFGRNENEKTAVLRLEPDAQNPTQSIELIPLAHPELPSDYANTAIEQVIAEVAPDAEAQTEQAAAPQEQTPDMELAAAFRGGETGAEQEGAGKAPKASKRRSVLEKHDQPKKQRNPNVVRLAIIVAITAALLWYIRAMLF